VTAIAPRLRMALCLAKTSLRDRDFYAWSLEQAALLREGRLAEADLEAITEEIESRGKTEKRELVMVMIRFRRGSSD
jgi:hypothetical protein